jgi:hypothetical protein
MENYLKFFTGYKYLIIGKIKGLAEESRRLRASILKSKKLPTHQAHLMSADKFLKSHIRHHLLAYAYLRGISYSKIELKCAPNNQPNPDHLVKIIKSCLPHYNDCYFTIENIKNWLKGA